MKRILISGASGFIGGEAIRAFRKEGWEAFGMGRRVLNDPQYIRHDLSHSIPRATLDTLRNVDVILHAAARSSPWGSRKQFERANVLATQHVLSAAEQLRLPKVIFVSSSSVYYQACDQLGLTELSPHAQPAVNDYAATKQIAETIVRSYSGPWAILRPRAVYGVGDTVLFPRILTAAQAGRLPQLVRTGSPAVGDLLSIRNLVHCFLKTASEPSILGDYNLTDNQPVEINGFLNSIFERLEIPLPRRRLSVSAAYRVAWCLEKFYSAVMPWKEPPITRFGVHVFAYSKTFDVKKMRETFGPSPQSVEEAVSEFVTWVKSEKPYH